MNWKRADELTEDDVVVETWTEEGDPQEVLLPIQSIVREDEKVAVVFRNGHDFTYSPDDQVAVQ